MNLLVKLRNSSEGNKDGAQNEDKNGYLSNMDLIQKV